MPRSPDPHSCDWAVGLTLNNIPETPQSVLVCWGQSVWWWKKSQEAYFFFGGGAGETTSKGVMLLFWTNGKKYGRGRIKELGKKLAEG